MHETTRPVKLVNGPCNGLVISLPQTLRTAGEIRIKNGAVPTFELGYPLYRANPEVKEFTDHGEDLYWFIEEKNHG